jgi:hypothetical protein
MELQPILPARIPLRRRSAVHIPLPKPRETLNRDSLVPALWGFYRHRKTGYITQVVSWIPHRGVGLLVQVHNFHRQFPRTMTFNPRLFERLFEYVDF